MKLLSINANKRNAPEKLEQVLEITLDGLIKSFQKNSKFI